MDNLLFSVDATLPIFVMMVLGVILQRLKIIDDEFASKLNSFVFKVPLPICVFIDLATEDFTSIWDTKFVLFCAIATILSILIVIVLSLLIKKDLRGEFIQVSYRSSAALIGIAFITNIYGNASIAALMIVGSVPIYNVVAVLALSLLKSGRTKLEITVVKESVIGVITNPIIIAILLGIIVSYIRIPIPIILEKSLTSVGNMATPLGLIAMGASFKLGKALSSIKPSVFATFVKLVLLATIFLPIAIHFGFRERELVTILVMLGSATTVACYVMARNMGHEGVLTTNVVMLTTLFSSVTLTGWLFTLRTLQYI
ncbi:MAG: AEC family transporter [Suipraeoptans sp.]